MLRCVVIIFFLCLLPITAWSFGGEGCGAGECSDCHSLSKAEALKLLPPGAEQINEIKFSEVGGLWEVKGQARGKMFTVYVDYSKHYLIAGNIIRLRDGVNISRSVEIDQLNSAGAFLIGNEAAAVKVFVFTDVNCSHCRHLHKELYKVVEQNTNIAFYVKLMALMTDKKKVNSIVCSGSIKLLDDAMADKPVPESDSACPAVDETMAFAKQWNIRSTPTLILPDGKILPGGRSADALLELLKAYLPDLSINKAGS